MFGCSALVINLWFTALDYSRELAARNPQHCFLSPNSRSMPGSFQVDSETHCSATPHTIDSNWCFGAASTLAKEIAFAASSPRKQPSCCTMLSSSANQSQKRRKMAGKKASIGAMSVQRHSTIVGAIVAEVVGSYTTLSRGNILQRLSTYLARFGKMRV